MEKLTKIFFVLLLNSVAFWTRWYFLGPWLLLSFYFLSRFLGQSIELWNVAFIGPDAAKILKSRQEKFCFSSRPNLPNRIKKKRDHSGENDNLVQHSSTKKTWSWLVPLVSYLSKCNQNIVQCKCHFLHCVKKEKTKTRNSLFHYFLHHVTHEMYNKRYKLNGIRSGRCSSNEPAHVSNRLVSQDEKRIQNHQF